MNDFYDYTVQDVTDNFDSVRVPLSSKQRANIEKIYPYYGAQNIIDYVDDYLFDGEYILVAEDGENLNSQNSKVCNLVNGQFWVNNHAHIIRAKEGHNTKYLCYYLNLLNFKPFVTGSAQPKLTKDNLNNIPLKLHSEIHQNSIAGILSGLDKKIELNNKINTELEAMAKLIYDYWFVQFDFPDANGKPYKSSGGKMVYNEALKREIPEVWGNGTLNDIGEIVGGSTPSTKKAENFTEHGMPWITPKDLSLNVGNKFITRGGVDVSDEGIKSASLKVYPKNTVLMSSRAPIGYMAIACDELTTNQGFKSFIANKGFASNYIFYTVKNSMKAIVQYSSGSTFKEVSGSVLKTVKICLPKTDTTNLYSEKVGSIFKRQNLLEIENKKLSELRDWLLPMLMNGQVTVKDT